MNYIVKARARLDLKRHWRFIARDSVESADRLLETAEQTFAFISANPGLGSGRNFRKLVGIRSRAIKEFTNYLVFYQQRGEKVIILRVLHGMTNLPRFFVRPRA
jgi:plasmid stabilization system protein ParE